MTISPDTPPIGRTVSTPVWRQLLVPVLLLAALIIAGRLLGGRWEEIQQAVTELGPRGWLLFVGAAVALATCCFPMAGLSLSAGALFGPWLGMLLLACSAWLSALVMFALARGLLRGRILSLVAGRPRLAALDRLVGERALRLNLLTRLAPFNFGLASYTLAAGRTSLGAFVVGTAGAMPGAAVYVWLGWLARDAGGWSGDDGRGRLILLAISLVVFAVLSFVLTRMVRQAWREAAAEPDSPESS